MTKKQDLAANIDEFVKSVEKETIKKVAKTSQGKLVAHVSHLVEEVKTLLQDNDNGFDKVIEYLALQEKNQIDLIKETNDAYQGVAKSIKELAAQTQSVKVTNHPKGITKKQVTEAFTDALEEVQNILTKQNEVPGSVAVTYNMQGKASTIVETYEGYKLTTNIRYTDGKVSGWTTKRG